MKRFASFVRIRISCIYTFILLAVGRDGGGGENGPVALCNCIIYDKDVNHSSLHCSRKHDQHSTVSYYHFLNRLVVTPFYIYFSYLLFCWYVYKVKIL